MHPWMRGRCCFERYIAKLAVKYSKSRQFFTTLPVDTHLLLRYLHVTDFSMAQSQPTGEWEARTSQRSSGSVQLSARKSSHSHRKHCPQVWLPHENWTWALWLTISKRCSGLENSRHQTVSSASIIWSSSWQSNLTGLYTCIQVIIAASFSQWLALNAVLYRLPTLVQWCLNFHPCFRSPNYNITTRSAACN
jgi:hypothetical protein